MCESIFITHKSPVLSIYCFHKCHIPLTVSWPSLETEDRPCKLKMLQKMKQFPNWSPQLLGNCKMFSWDTEGGGWWCINHFPCFCMTKSLNDVKNITKYLMWKSRTKNERFSRYKYVTWQPLWEVVGLPLVSKGHVRKQREGSWARLIKMYCCCNVKLKEKEHGSFWH